ncbi:DUF4232 domain-containing protein [Kineococcus rhizosphaerae]|uniref:Uncharacterized protein DUF4232 n=1 Tax=Kineococcus rhizosphaerae TaxID=559628 RepID=A0A2T0R5F5_9ACTN|nr:DUF4232 domain-containing protein [Kineococcus rhizosphaerae]PRY15998.1 uncharacterized protein DUF4232 [Kineococcus rhizosphaerae]
MSSVLHPVGPEDKGTYWRRRLVVVLALVVVVVLVALGVRALASPDANAQQPTKLDPSTVATTPSPTTTPAGTPTGTPTASGTDTATGTATATGTQTGTQAAGAACSTQSLNLTLTSEYSAYGPGKTPKLVLTVKNTSQAACSVEIGTAVRTFTASSGGTQVWSSADCQSQTASQTYQLDPGGTRSMSTVWSRQRSAPGCPTGQEAVAAGNYTIGGSWNGMDAQPVTITLTS